MSGQQSLPQRIWDIQNECATRQQIAEIQWHRFKETLNRVYAKQPIYRKKMDALKLTPADIKTPDDIRLLPFTEKADFMTAYPLGMLVVDKKEVVRIHGSSGTTLGKSSIVGYTRNDIELWANLCARFITAAGVGPEDIAQVCFGYGLFTGGFGLHYGLEKVGAMVIPLSSGNTERHIRFILDFGTTTIVGTPSYALVIGETLKRMGYVPEDTQLKWGLFGAEAWSEGIRQQIESALGIIATDNYGLSEIIGPGVSGECLYKNGMHISEDHFLCEIIDPDTGEPLPEGKTGELVITTLSNEAVPVIRYRTRDLTSITTTPCPCGRTTARMSKVLGRTDDMIIIRGVNVFPSQIEELLMRIKGTEPHYQIILNKDGALDTLEVQVEVTEEIFNDEMRKLKMLQEEIAEKLRAELGLTVIVKLVEPRTLERFVGKAKRVIDLRPK